MPVMLRRATRADPSLALDSCERRPVPGDRGGVRCHPPRVVRLVACATCGLLFNADHDERLVEYSSRCIETQVCSPTIVSSPMRSRGNGWTATGSGGHRCPRGGMWALCELPPDDVRADRWQRDGVDPAVVPENRRAVTLISPTGFERDACRTPGARAVVSTYARTHCRRHGFLRRRNWEPGSSRHPAAPVLFELPDAGRILREVRILGSVLRALLVLHCFRDIETRSYRPGSAGAETALTRGQFLLVEARVP